MKDYHDHEEMMTFEGLSDGSDSNWLINEIKNFDVKNRDDVQNVQFFIRSQNKRIRLLQEEVKKLMSMQIACEESTFTSTDGYSTDSGEFFFSICSDDALQVSENLFNL